MIECRVKYTPKLILANSEEEFEKLYAQALAEYDKLNPQSVIDEYNRMLDEQAQKLAKYQK